jgi:isoprenylcysteine carboxyl methyltransferase (ICMT) family protein YpbQ
MGRISPKFSRICKFHPQMYNSEVGYISLLSSQVRPTYTFSEKNIYFSFTTEMNSQQGLPSWLMSLLCASFSFHIVFIRLAKYPSTHMQTLPNRGLVSKTWHKVLHGPNMFAAVIPLHVTMWQYKNNLWFFHSAGNVLAIKFLCVVIKPAVKYWRRN